MSTVKALAEVLGAVLDALQERCMTPRCVEEQCSLCRSEGPLYERLKDIIAVESAGERLVTNEAGRAAERAQQAPMTATRAQVLAEVEERYTVTPEGAWQEMLNRKIAEHEQELNRLFEAHQRRELKLQLESDRRARSVAEAIIERVVQIGITERKAIEDINIDAIVTGTKHT